MQVSASAVIATTNMEAAMDVPQSVEEMPIRFVAEPGETASTEQVHV